METDEGARVDDGAAKPAFSSNPYAAPAAEPRPEATATRAPLASLGKRFLGNILDRVVELTGGTLLSRLVEHVFDVPRTTELVFACALPVLALQWVLIVVRGQSIGKLLLRTRIVLEDGSLPGFGRGVALRAWPLLFLQLLQLTLPIGMLGGKQPLALLALADALFIFRRGERRCLHDYIAGTWVVDVPRR
jgi:uncharacterized RDD family membrane protein YckC